MRYFRRDHPSLSSPMFHHVFTAQYGVLYLLRVSLFCCSRDHAAFWIRCVTLCHTVSTVYSVRVLMSPLVVFHRRQHRRHCSNSRVRRRRPCCAAGQGYLTASCSTKYRRLYCTLNYDSSGSNSRSRQQVSTCTLFHVLIPILVYLG